MPNDDNTEIALVTKILHKIRENNNMKMLMTLIMNNIFVNITRIN